jgi:hypothetical protein
MDCALTLLKPLGDERQQCSIGILDPREQAAYVPQLAEFPTSQPDRR